MMLPENKIKSLIMAIGVLIAAESIGVAYFVFRSHSLQKKLEQVRPGYEKLVTQHQQLENEQTALTKELEVVKDDRSNILLQLKNLLSEKNKAKELQAVLDNLIQESGSLKKDKLELKNDNDNLNSEVKKLQVAQKELSEQKEKLQADFEREQNKSRSRQLEAEKKTLEKEKSSLSAENRQLLQKCGVLQKSEAELKARSEELERSVSDFTQKLSSALQKNKELAQGVKNMPAKFSEIARQNKVLLKQTSQMHYNLGVFYTKNKEYERALAEFERVIEINPDDAYAHFNLGYIYAEYIVNRPKATEHFRHFLRLAKSDDQDVDWVKKYLLTWETYEGKKLIQ
jgi:chromosome segregation ATPase